VYARGESCCILTPNSLFGPFRFGLRGRNRRDNAGSFATILVLVFILIGVARSERILFFVAYLTYCLTRTMRNLYIFNRSVAQRLLVTLEDVILEVG
jgi:hypothetical protein